MINSIQRLVLQLSEFATCMPGGGSPIKKKERKFYKVSLRGASISFCGRSYVSSSIFPGFYLKKDENNSGYFGLLVPQ